LPFSCKNLLGASVRAVDLAVRTSEKSALDGMAIGFELTISGSESCDAVSAQQQEEQEPYLALLKVIVPGRV
jgi:hypothetical protein